MSFPQTKISTVAKFINGFAFKPADWCEVGYPIIRIQNLTDPSKPFNRTQRKVPEKYIVRKGDILVSWSATIDIFEWELEDSLLNQHIFKVVFDESKIDKSYFKIALKQTIRELSRFAHGSTMKHIVKRDFENHKIVLPEGLEYQIRIATLLSRVEALIATRKNNLQQLDGFLKSTFLEMFGDPVRNEKGWEKAELGKLLYKIDSGWSPKCEARPATDEEWGVLKLGSVTQCEYTETENKALPDGVSPRKEKEVKNGDLLFSRKNTYALVAAAAYVFKTRKQLLMPDLIFRLEIKDSNELNPLYLWKLLTNKRQRSGIQSLAGGAAGSMPNISKQKLRTTEIPKPPIQIQNRFAKIVDKIECIKILYQANLSGLQKFYHALSQKAFKGELDLSRIPLPEKKQTTEHTEHTEKAQEKTSVYSVVKKDFSKPAQRQQLFNQWFSDYQAAQTRQPFDLDACWQYAEEQARTVETEDSPPLGLSDYEQLKTWLFEHIHAGKLEQAFSLESKQIELKQK